MSASTNTYDVCRDAAGVVSGCRLVAANEHAAALTMARGILDHVGTTNNGTLHLYLDSHNDGLVSVRLIGSAANVCDECGCTDNDCSGCIERTGEPCHWITPDLCSACAKLPDDDPQCICGTYRSEHALCGCEQFEAKR